ncbi:MAG: hypothetical protein V8R75_16455 [Oscillospiraceae bacterium]
MKNLTFSQRGDFQALKNRKMNLFAEQNTKIRQFAGKGIAFPIETAYNHSNNRK